MKDKVKAMFADVTMPESCEAAIRQAAGEKALKGKKSRGRVLRPVLATVMALALVVCLSPTVRAAAESWVRELLLPELGLKIYENETEGQTVYFDTESEAFAEIRDGRLYFTGNGQDMDITDEIREDKPFFYQYVDEDTGMTNYMAVGYSGSLENFGVYEFVREPGENLQSWEGWVTGVGRNMLNPETDSVYPWVALVWEEWDIPWPMGGA